MNWKEELNNQALEEAITSEWVEKFVENNIREIFHEMNYVLNGQTNSERFSRLNQLGNEWLGKEII